MQQEVGHSLFFTRDVFLYKPVILPQLPSGAPTWYHKNVDNLQTIQTSDLRCYFKHGPSSSIQASHDFELAMAN